MDKEPEKKEPEKRNERTERIDYAVKIVKRLMEEKKLTQEFLADKLHTTQPNLNKCLRNGFSYSVLCSIADYFDLSLDYLAGRRGKNHSETEQRFKNRVNELLNFVSFMKDEQGLPKRIMFYNEEEKLNERNFDIAYDELAEHLGITEKEMRDYLLRNDVSGFLSMEQIEKIADFFHVSLDYLFGRKRRGFAGLEKADLAANMLNDGNVSAAMIRKDGIEYPAFYFPESEGKSRAIMNRRLLDNAAVNRYVKNRLDAKEKLESGDYDIQTYNAVVAAYESQLKNKLQNPQIMQAEIALENAKRNAEKRKKKDPEPENQDSR